MKKIVLSVIVCLCLIALVLPSCAPGSGNEPLNLAPGGIVSGVHGVSVGAPEGALDETIEILIEEEDDPSGEVPFPEYLSDAEVVGDFYGISAAQDFSTVKEHYLILGLPVPDGISTDDLWFIVLVPPDSIIMDQPDDSPSLRWILLSGVYDPESGLFGTLLPSLFTEPQVFALLDSSTAGWETSTDSGHFRVESVGFNSTESPEAHRVMTADALNEAYAAYVEQMDFEEPDLRHHVEVIRFAPDPTVTINVTLYDYQLQRGEHNGFYNPSTRTAATKYPGAPDTPNLIFTHHEFFHSIQFAYAALRANWPSSELRRTIEAAAVAAELSLDGLTRSNQPLDTRDPLPVTRGLWSSSEALSYGYRAQDFLVYLGRVINATDPQLSFMIPWFEQGGLMADLDTMLQADLTFDSLSDAYWQWAKNHAFEKQVILGVDRDDVTVPHGDACSWSGHGDLMQVSLSPETWTWEGDDTDFTLGPLTSRVFELTLNPGASSYEVTLTISSTDPDIEFKFYEEGEAGGEGCWDEARDSVPHTFYVGEEAVTSHLLISNTNVDTESDPISLVAAGEEPEYTPMVAAGERHTVGLKSDNTVVAVGDDFYGQCDVSDWTGIIQIAAGQWQTVGLKSDGMVVAAGLNDYGQCDVGGWPNIIQVAGGEDHMLGLKSDGTVVAVGKNWAGSSDVESWTNIIQVAGGASHTVGLRSDGTVIAVGSNANGQCDVDGWADIIQVAAGFAWTVGLKSDGTVIAVGDNYWGQCDVDSWTDIIHVAGGGFISVGLESDGTVFAVGYNYWGQCEVSGWDLI